MTTQLIKLPEVIQLTNRSRTMLMKDVACGLFPAPFNLGGDLTRGTYYISSEVNEIIIERGAGANDSEIKELVIRLKENREERFQELLISLGL